MKKQNYLFLFCSIEKIQMAIGAERLAFERYGQLHMSSIQQIWKSERHLRIERVERGGACSAAVAKTSAQNCGGRRGGGA